MLLPVRLRRHLQAFLRHRRVEGLAASTLSGNELHLRRFIDWLEKERPQLEELVSIDHQVLEDFAFHLAVEEGEDGQRLLASTRYGWLASLAVFFRWLKRTGRILANPALEVPYPKLPVKLPRGVLTQREVERVLDVPDLKSATGLRARAILELLYSSGVRNAELRSLELQDLNFAEGLVTVRLGKGAKDRVVPMGTAAMHYLKRYLDEVRPAHRRRSEEHVFLSRYGRPFSKTQLLLLMERTGKKAGLRKPLTCHGLRHSCATHLLRNHADIRHIQELLGHRSLATTQVYTHVSASDLKRVHARCHPRERDKA